MTALKNDRFLRALRREPVDRTPVWLMRQAGRYLPEYREVRAQAGNFMALATDPERACQVTLQPLERFDLDAAIIFSDILTVPDAMGLGLYFETGEGPRFERPVRSAREVEKLKIPDPEDDLGYVMDAIRLTRRELDGRIPLIGFAGSPWTVATYMVEGGSSKNYAHIKTMLYRHPDDLHALLAATADATEQYLLAQWRAGAQALMIFDTWGGMLSSAAYEEFSLAYMQRIVATIKATSGAATLPLILFTKGGCQWLEKMAASGCDALGLDWTCDLSHARRRVGARVALQGNLDPGVLYGDDETVQREVARVLASFGHGSGHVFNLGHGIHPGVDPARVATLVAAVHDLSRAYHA